MTSEQDRAVHDRYLTLVDAMREVMHWLEHSKISAVEATDALTNALAREGYQLHLEKD